MNTREIEEKLSSNPVTKNVFRGVFPCDKVPDALGAPPTAIVINTDPSTDTGMHWVAVYQDRAGTLEFFDSFGKNVGYYGKCLTKALTGKNTIIKQSGQLQSIFSTLCGQYCMFFIYKRASGDSFSSIVNSFSGDTLTNDFIVNQFAVLNFNCKNHLAHE